MTDISIPAGALEAGVKAAIALDSGPEGSKLFEIHYAEFAESYRASIRAAFLAMVGNWEGMRPYKGSIKALVLPLEPARDD